MKVLVVGAGVVGTVYGAHLAAAGNAVWVSGTDRGPMKWQPEASVSGGGRGLTRLGGEQPWCRMPAATTTSSWLRSGVISWPPRVPVLPAWRGNQRSCSWATTREAGCHRCRPAR